MTLYLENIGGCSDSINSLICILPDFNLYVPNSFTPNTDKCNDEFYVKGVGDFIHLIYKYTKDGVVK